VNSLIVRLGPPHNLILPGKSLRKATPFVLACPHLEVDSLPALTSKSAQGQQ